MARREPPTPVQVAELLEKYISEVPGQELRLVPYRKFAEYFRAELRTTRPKALEWLRDAMTIEDPPLWGFYTTDGRVTRVMTRSEEYEKYRSDWRMSDRAYHWSEGVPEDFAPLRVVAFNRDGGVDGRQVNAMGVGGLCVVPTSMLPALMEYAVKLAAEVEAEELAKKEARRDKALADYHDAHKAHGDGIDRLRSLLERADVKIGRGTENDLDVSFHSTKDELLTGTYVTLRLHNDAIDAVGAVLRDLGVEKKTLILRAFKRPITD